MPIVTPFLYTNTLFRLKALTIFFLGTPRFDLSAQPLQVGGGGGGGFLQLQSRESKKDMAMFLQLQFYLEIESQCFNLPQIFIPLNKHGT